MASQANKLFKNFIFFYLFFQLRLKYPKFEVSKPIILLTLNNICKNKGTWVRLGEGPPSHRSATLAVKIVNPLHSGCIIMQQQISSIHHGPELVS